MLMQGDVEGFQPWGPQYECYLQTADRNNPRMSWTLISLTSAGLHVFLTAENTQLSHSSCRSTCQGAPTLKEMRATVSPLDISIFVCLFSQDVVWGLNSLFTVSF